MFWAVSTAMMPTTIFQPVTSGVIGCVRWRGAPAASEEASPGGAVSGAGSGSGAVTAPP